METTVVANISQHSAILAGKQQYGKCFIVIDPSTLTADQRKSLVGMQSGYFRRDDGAPVSDNYYVVDMDNYGEATAETIAARLTEISAKRLALEAETALWVSDLTDKYLLMTIDEFISQCPHSPGHIEKAALADTRLADKILAHEVWHKQAKEKEKEEERLASIERQQRKEREAVAAESKQQAENAEIRALATQISVLDVLLKYERWDQAKKAIVEHYAAALTAKISAAGHEIIDRDGIKSALGLDEDGDIDYDPLDRYKGDVPVAALQSLDAYRQIIGEDGDADVYFPDESSDDPILVFDHAISKYGITLRVMVKIYQWE